MVNVQICLSTKPGSSNPIPHPRRKFAEVRRSQLSGGGDEADVATNAAFKLLPDGTVETLLKPENQGMLTAVLTYHVVSGRYDAKALMDLIHKGHGQAIGHAACVREQSCGK